MKVLIIGDSRASSFNDQNAPMSIGDTRTIYSQPGLRIEQISSAVDRAAFNLIEDPPTVVLLVGLLCDFYNWETYPCHEQQFRALTFRDPLTLPLDDFPARMRTIEQQVVSIWPGVRCVWVLPYPVDLPRYWLHRWTGAFGDHLGCFDDEPWHTYSQEERHLRFFTALAAYQLQEVLKLTIYRFNVVPWINVWKEDDLEWINYAEYLRSSKDSTEKGSFPRRFSSDGLHPSNLSVSRVWEKIQPKLRVASLSDEWSLDRL